MREPRMQTAHPPIEILGMRPAMSPVFLKWGGQVLATFSFQCWPFVIGDARLLRTPDGDFKVSMNAGRKPRVSIADDRFKGALLAAAVAAFTAKTAHLRPAVSARREGSISVETTAS